MKTILISKQTAFVLAFNAGNLAVAGVFQAALTQENYSDWVYVAALLVWVVVGLAVWRFLRSPDARTSGS